MTTTTSVLSRYVAVISVCSREIDLFPDGIHKGILRRSDRRKTLLACYPLDLKLSIFQQRVLKHSQTAYIGPGSEVLCVVVYADSDEQSRLYEASSE